MPFLNACLLWMFAAAFLAPRAAAAGCTPIYPGCTCQTEALTCEDILEIRTMIAKKVWGLRVPGNDTDSLYASMEALKADPAVLSVAAGDWIGGLVRLVWHDAAEFDPESEDDLGVDGCLDLTNMEHSGLSKVIADVDELWMPVCHKISRADFWVLAAKTAIEESTSYAPSEFGRNVNAEDGGSHGTPAPERLLLKGEEVIQAYVLPFRYGRVDKVSCTVPSHRMPSAELAGAAQLQEYVMKKFGLSVRNTVALMGAHTLGRCEIPNSGYNSSWKDRSDLFTTTYFKLLVEAKWDRVQMEDPRTHDPLFQWNIDTKSDRERFAMMLATDIGMVYAIDPEQRETQTWAASCGPLDKEDDKKNPEDRCQTTGSVHPELNFQDYVLEFANGTTDSHDEPGASSWLIAFAEAFKTMTEAGYRSRDLQTAMCPPAVCPDCSQDVLGCGALFFVDSNYTSGPFCSDPQVSQKCIRIPRSLGQRIGAVPCSGTGIR